MYTESTTISFNEPEPEKKIPEKPKPRAPFPPKEEVKEEKVQLKGIRSNPKQY